MNRPRQRFVVIAKKANGAHRAQRSVDTLDEAWSWFAFFTKTHPLDEVVLVDREEEVEANS